MGIAVVYGYARSNKIGGCQTEELFSLDQPAMVVGGASSFMNIYCTFTGQQKDSPVEITRSSNLPSLMTLKINT